MAAAPRRSLTAGDWPDVGAPAADRWQAAQAELFTAMASSWPLCDARRCHARPPGPDFRNNALGTGLSHYVTLHGVIHHTIYHAGQIALLKRALG